MAHKRRFREFLNDFCLETTEASGEKNQNNESVNISNEKIEIFILQRGSITKKTADIWIKKITQHFSYVSISCQLNDNTYYVIIPDEFDVAKLKKWDQGLYLQKYNRLMFLKPSWAFECIRTLSVPVFEVHAHPFVSWEKLSLYDNNHTSTNTNNNNSNNIPTTTTSQQVPSTQVSNEHTKSSCQLPPVPVVLDLTSSPPKEPIEIVKNRKHVSMPYDGDKDSQDDDEAIGPLFSSRKAEFVCVSSGTNSSSEDRKLSQENKNTHITSILDQLQEIYQLEGDQWRANSYKRVSSMLSRMKRISDADELKAVRGIGDSIREKIQEIIQTGTLQKLKAFQNNETISLRLAFAKIWGVGPSSAQELVNKGYKSIEDLKKRGISDLTAQQRIGLNRYEDFQLRIPREEVQQIEALVISQLQKIDPGTEGVVCGSYRRGKLWSGDVDILIYATDGRDEIDVLPDLVQSLSRIGFLTDHLSLPSDRGDDQGIATYMGVCRLNFEGSRHRRIDLKCYPRSCLAFALLYFTGSDHFNRSMRLYASKLGYTLSDQGLYPFGRDLKRFKTWKGSLIHCYTEKEIFDALGLEYKSPIQRNCLDINNLIDEEKKRTKTTGATSGGSYDGDSQDEDEDDVDKL